MSDDDVSYDGGCACGHVRYRVTSPPLVVHCCHCSFCQRQSGSAFAINALVEADRVMILKGDVVDIVTLSPSGKNQKLSRCPNCQAAEGISRREALLAAVQG